MANQIARNLALDPDPVGMVAQHIQDFWTPRMKHMAFALMARGWTRSPRSPRPAGRAAARRRRVLMSSPDGARAFRFANISPMAARRAIDRALAVEAPVAIEINGIGYAVMMATPTDLEDYALGFCLSEQLIAAPDEFVSADAHAIDGGGWMLRVQIAPSRAAPLLERARLRLAEGSCGLCGIESLEQVLRPLPQVTARLDVADTALFAALAALPTISRWARRRAPPTPPRSARPMARSWPRARTSAATTPSTSWSARWRARGYRPPRLRRADRAVQLRTGAEGGDRGLSAAGHGVGGVDHGGGARRGARAAAVQPCARRQPARILTES
jgi:hypothetical protein